MIFFLILFLFGNSYASLDKSDVKYAEETLKKSQKESIVRPKDEIQKIIQYADEVFKNGNINAAVAEYERVAFLDLENYDTLLNYALLVAKGVQKNDESNSVSYPSKEKARYSAVCVFSNSKNNLQKAKALLLLDALEYHGNLDYYQLASEFYDLKKLRKEDPLYANISVFNYKKYEMNEAARTPTICFSFNQNLKDNFKYEDYIKVDPNVEGSIKVSQRNICISNFKYAQTYEVTFKKNMPNLANEVLNEDIKISVVTKNQESKLALPGDAFILLKEDQQHVPLSYTNVDKVKLKLVRISDKAFHSYIINNNGSVFLPEYNPFYQSEKDKQIIFEGTMDLSLEKNKNNVKQIPLHEMVKDLKPGLYWLSAEQDKSFETNYKCRTGQWILITDMGLTTLKGSDGYYVQARSFSKAKPMKDVSIHLISAMNEDLNVLKTDADGFVKFDTTLFNGINGDRPKIILAYDDKNNFTYMKLNVPAFDLTDRGVDGKQIYGNYDAYVYTEQGVYRPGSSLNVNALLRDYKGKTLKNIPLFFKISRPDGQVMEVQKVKGDENGHYEVIFKIPSAARLGLWHVQTFIDPTKDPIGKVSFGVEDFVPSRLFVALKDLEKILLLDKDYHFGLESNYLFGLPAAKLDTEAHILIQKQKNPFPQYKGYSWGNKTETFETKRISLDKKQLDENGLAMFDIKLDKNIHSSYPLEAEIIASVFEESGRERTAKQKCLIKTNQICVGLKTDEHHPYALKQVPVDVLTVNSDGEPESKKLTYEIYEEEVYYTWQNKSGEWNYTPSIDEKFHLNGTIETDKDGKATLSFANDGFKQYKIVIKNEQDDVVSSIRTEVGYRSNNRSHQSPDQLKINIDKSTYKEGDKILVNIQSPFDGELLLTLAGDRVFSNKNFSLKAGDNSIKLDANADWGNGVYILATAMRPLDHLSKQSKEDQLLPKRAVGVQWIQMDMSESKLNVKIETIQETLPKKTIDVKLKVEGNTKNKTFVTLAMVDEGILFLTDFKNPDPYSFFYTKHLLNVEIRDLYAKIINPLEGQVGELKTGGDAALLSKNLSAISKRTFKLVSFYQKAIEFDKNGEAIIKLDIPEFNGTLRIMAVAYNEDAVGSAEAKILVREPIVIEPILPRFLLEGDAVDISLSLHDTKEKEGCYSLTIETTGPISVEDYKKEINLPKDKIVPLKLKGTETGDAVIKISLKGEDISPIEQTVDISVLHKGNTGIAQQIQFVKPGETFKTDKHMIDSFEEKGRIVSASASFSIPWNIDMVAKSLKDYPFSCTEQLATKGIGLNALKDEDGLQDILSMLSQRQTREGSFALWIFGPANACLTTYVYEFLKSHKEKAALMTTLTENYLKSEIVNSYSYIDPTIKAYTMYVLEDNIEPGQIRVFFDTEKEKIKTNYGRALLLNLCARIGDSERVKKAIELFNQDANNETFSYRSKFAEHLNTFKVLKEAAEMIPDIDLSKIIEKYASFKDIIPEKLSTQDASAILSLYSKGDEKPECIENPKEIINKTDKSKWYCLTVEGVQKEIKTDIAKGIEVKRSFYNTKGQEVHQFQKGDLIVIVLSAEIKETLTPHGEIILVDRLPSCFEHEKYMLDPKEGLPWFKVDQPTSQMKKEDRYLATFSSDQLKTVKVAYTVRATFNGDFEYPSFEVLDMFNPNIYGKIAHTKIQVKEAK